ncbi:hypothetical protein Q3G72_003722 [Acer saccharum]|nr:hypothetical protein Q3G72_003722 [Acer saccharum]
MFSLTALCLACALFYDSLPFLPLELPNLSHLTFTINDVVASASLIDLLVRMIEMCPFLQKFTLKLISDDHGRNYRRRTINQFPGFSHQHLKVVEFIGFVGCPVDLELAFYLLENVTMLEKMIVNTTSPFLMETYSEFYDDEKKQANRKRAEQLKETVPQGVELVIC